MATCNGEQFLRQQIDSVLNQGYENFEFIICDDNSDDSTIDIISSYLLKHPQIKLYKNSSCIGVVKNFEKGITLSRGDYIALCDQDDIWRVDKLNIYLNQLKNINRNLKSAPIMIHSDLRMISSTDKIIKSSYFQFRKYKLRANKDLSHIVGPCGVMGNTILMNSKLKEYILPFPDALAVHDYWIALINEIYGYRITVNDTLVDYRIHEKNFSNSKNNIDRSFLKVLKNILTLKIRKMPYLNIGREKVISQLLKREDIPKNDKELLEKYLKYFDKHSSRILKFYILVRYDFVKRDLLYRLNLFMSILFLKKI